MVSLSHTVYHFENYVEIWYQIPVRDMVSEEVFISSPTVFVSYDYKLDVRAEAMDDSALKQGTKGTSLTAEEQNDYFIDYIPIYLYPGNFRYQVNIASERFTTSGNGTIEISADSAYLACSDILLGRKVKRGFLCHGYSFIPIITSEIGQWDTLFSYLEIYGLVPDSLTYTITYRIRDSLEKTVFTHKRQRIKYDYKQVDTCSIKLSSFVQGRYVLSIELTDLSTQTSVSQERSFIIASASRTIPTMMYYYDIHLLVDASEYEKFTALPRNGQLDYLKAFWSRHDYRIFEERIIEADEQFSVGLIRGRNTARGRFYINHGPPDDVAIMESDGKPCELWHYYKEGYNVLFRDREGDGNPELVKVYSAHEEVTDEDTVPEIEFKVDERGVPPDKGKQ